MNESEKFYTRDRGSFVAEHWQDLGRHELSYADKIDYSTLGGTHGVIGIKLKQPRWLNISSQQNIQYSAKLQTK